jgi:competence protein ComEA
VPNLSRSELAAYAVCVLLVAVLGWRALRSETAVAPATASSAKGATTPTVSVREAAPGSALVYVVGAVRRPGVYRLKVGQRVQDAIRRAGGALSTADLQAINLAAKVADAQQVNVPRRSAAPASTGAAAASGATAALAPGTPVNLNTATAEQLDTLDGVGPATAEKILEFRAQRGGFTSVDDLGQIPGIGPKRLETLRSQVQL